MSTVQQDDDYATKYGGVFFGYNEENVHLWAPNKNDGYESGHIVNLIGGWAADKKTDHSNQAKVRVQVR